MTPEEKADLNALADFMRKLDIEVDACGCCGGLNFSRRGAMSPIVFYNTTLFPEGEIKDPHEHDWSEWSVLDEESNKYLIVRERSCKDTDCGYIDKSKELI